jgi:single-strand DNA-binding protein
MNKVCLVGRLTKDPTCEYVNTNNGSVARARFTIAVDRGFANNQDGNNNRTADFISVVAWRKQAENIARYCHKGTQVAVEGRLQTNNYEAQDGTRRYSTDIVCDNVSFLGSRGDSANQNSSAPQNMENDVEVNEASEDPFKDFGDEVTLTDDDLPF